MENGYKSPRKKHVLPALPVLIMEWSLQSDLGNWVRICMTVAVAAALELVSSGPLKKNKKI